MGGVAGHVAKGLVDREGRNCCSHFWNIHVYFISYSFWQGGVAFSFSCKVLLGQKLGTCQRKRGAPGIQGRVHGAQPLLHQVGPSSHCWSQRWCPGGEQVWGLASSGDTGDTPFLCFPRVCGWHHPAFFHTYPNLPWPGCFSQQEGTTSLEEACKYSIVN